jgi:uncharacterized protein YdeI (YjbR/CyaY-like superfamily)
MSSPGDTQPPDPPNGQNHETLRSWSIGRTVGSMSVDVDAAIPISRAPEFDRWLAEHGSTEREVVVAIASKASGRQTVTLTELQEVALCHGWVDTQTRRIDAERYAIRFVPRRPGSNWSPTNRELARGLLAEGRMTAAGAAKLPPDL